MRNFVAAGGKTLFVALLALTLGTSVFAQASLRKAMDTDADGKQDFMVFRPSNNVWYVAKSGGGFTFQTFA